VIAPRYDFVSTMHHSPIRLDWPERDFSQEAPDASLTVLRRGSPSATLITGDNLAALRALRKRVEATVTLAYLDPPFLTGKRHDMITRRRSSRSI
jgi:hypothetical protein